jgi:hypothetical protein
MISRRPSSEMTSTANVSRQWKNVHGPMLADCWLPVMEMTALAAVITAENAPRLRTCVRSEVLEKNCRTPIPHPRQDAQRTTPRWYIGDKWYGELVASC